MWDLFLAVEEVPLPPGSPPTGGGDLSPCKQEKGTERSRKAGTGVETFETYRPYLFAIASRLLGSAMDVEDLV